MIPSFLIGGSSPNHLYRTCTVNLAVAVLPNASVAEQLTVVMPRGKRLPDGGTQVTGTALF